jgi:uncharacterized protein (DUF1015 family)
MMNEWLRRGILIRDERPAIYIYFQNYKYAGRSIQRVGFISRMGLDLGRKTKILPHENTLLAPKLDRLELTRATKSNLSPIFVLYEDAMGKVGKILRNFAAKNRPIINVNFEGVNNKLWKMDDAALIARIQKLLGDSNVFIADGHHRYEVSRMYAREIQKKNVTASERADSKYTIAYFVESRESALTILPAHRVAKDIGGLTAQEMLDRIGRFFVIEKLPDLKRMMARLGNLNRDHVFGMYPGGKDFYILRLKDLRYSDDAIKDKPVDWKRLDVSILHLFIFQKVLGISDSDDNIEFFKSPEEAADVVRKRHFTAAFFLNPTKAWQVRRIAHIGQRMPRKATYFYPKPISGLVINKHGNQE